MTGKSTSEFHLSRSHGRQLMIPTDLLLFISAMGSSILLYRSLVRRFFLRHDHEA